MKLELKRLVGYLPYGLKIKILNHKCDYVGIEFSEVSGYYFLGDSLHVSYNGGSAGKSIDDFKPILRPLSDLLNGNYEDILDEFSEQSLEAFKMAFLSDLRPLDAFDKINYTIAIKLFEYHFDVFGLIEQGLAIDVNTL